jgi:hypothetical protein
MRTHYYEATTNFLTRARKIFERRPVSANVQTADKREGKWS